MADAIGAGLSTAFDVSVVPVSQAGPEVLRGTDLVVVGGPTHAHGMRARLLRTHGFDVVTEPESFLVTKQDRLAPGELTRARQWGARLATVPGQPTAVPTIMPTA